MKLYLKNGSEINLSNNDFIASGGEGEIYKKGTTAYKIYSDKTKMIPIGKIDELSKISNSHVINPREVLFDIKKVPVGYSMPLVPRSVSLCRIFTKAFKDKEGVSTDNILSLINSFRDDVKNVHSKNILIVDCNELNFLVDDKFSAVFFIDVDSYQTEHYPATALMDSVKDWQANGKWTRESDWYSWGIITFQMLMGIHPYKGKYISDMNLIDRMKNGISVFNKDVKVPKIVPSFQLIPSELKDWYRAIFEDRKRIAPPDFVNGQYVIVSTKDIIVSAVLQIDQVDCFKDSILSVIDMGDAHVFTCRDGSYKKSNLPCDAINIDNGFIYNGNHYEAKNGSLVLRQVIGTSKIVSDTIVANIMQNSSTCFDGVVMQNMLGSHFATFCPKARQSYTKKIDQLTTKDRIVDAKFDSGVLMIIACKEGKYNKYIVRFNDSYTDYVCWEYHNIALYALNFAVLDTGVCAEIDQDENLVLFAAQPVGDRKIISDNAISQDMKLFAQNNKLMFFKDKSVFSLSMKK